MHVVFNRLDNLLSPHFGEIWEKYKELGFENIEERMAINRTSEEFPSRVYNPQLELIQSPDFTRVWFTQKDKGRVVQVQKDRFIFNWYKSDESEIYSGFNSIYSEFSSLYDIFCRSVDSMGIGNIEPVQYELTYIDQIDEDNEWNKIKDVWKVFNVFNDSEFLVDAESLILKSTFAIKDIFSRLHVSINNIVDTVNNTNKFQSEFTMRGFPVNSDKEMLDWFNLSHGYIRHKFICLFTQSIQNDIWVKK